MDRPLVWILTSLCLMSLIAKGQAVTCYVCNSHYDKTCYDLGADNSSGLLRDCDLEPISKNHTNVPEKYTICRKMTVGLPGEERPRVVRSCSWVKHKNDCYYTATKDIKSTVCQCTETGCNYSPFLKNAWIMSVVGFLSVMLITRVR